MTSSTFTITFGDQAENHAGMQKIGQSATEGFSLEDLNRAKGVKSSLIDLRVLIGGQGDEAYLLVLHQGLNAILQPYTADHFYQEQTALEKDTKAFMYGRVVNKHARHNLCFGFQDQAPNYEAGQGRVISFEKVPLLNYVRNAFPVII